MLAILNTGEDEEDGALHIPTKGERKRADFRNRLIDEGHLVIFQTWHALGGLSNPPSVTELFEWPADWLHDFLYLLRRMGELSKQEKRLNAAHKGKPSK